MGLRRISFQLGLLASVIALLGAAPAQAGVLVQTTTSCDAQQYSTPFARFGDYANYTPVPGGSFEAGGPMWSLTGGAKLVSGNESYKVGSDTDSRSLYLPAGATATSPAMCVGLQHPTIRWFNKQLSLLNLTGTMTVEVLFEDSLGQVLSLPIGAGLLSSNWDPSLPGVVTANLLPLLPGQMTPVAFRFRAVTGTWSVDDVYVDPYRSW